jgi:hypothetical protein
MLNPKRPGVEDLLAVLNSGYKLWGMRIANTPKKGGGWEFEELPTFSPVAIAGNSPLLPDDTRSRCIVIRLLPDIDGKTQGVGAITAVSSSQALSKAIVGPVAFDRKFSNCAALNKVYPGGVAKNKKVSNTGGATKFTPAVKPRIYSINSSKDRDKDGIACER